MDFGRAFGAGGAGTPFDPMTFITKPQVVLRLTSILFSIVVFGCIAAGGDEMGVCIMKGDSNACGYGIGIGVIAFIAAILFLVADAFFEQISSVQTRKYITMVDLAFSGLWTFLWFVGFCYLTNQWRTTDPNFLADLKVPGWKYNNVRASIAFSFFSIIVWAGLIYLALQRYREGSAGTFRSADDIDDQLGSGPGSYQQPPLDEPIVGGGETGGNMSSGISPGMGAGGTYQTGPGY